VYREVVLTVPRQSGKTTLLLVLILLRALGARAQNIRYTAQTGSDARKKWMDDWLPALKESPFSAFYRERLTNGHEALLFKNGSLQGLVATTKKSGHGGSLDLGILDEAFAHPDARLEQALKPAMITRPQPQLWIVSTAGTKKDSPYLWGKVETGRAMVERGLTDSTAYFEWSARRAWTRRTRLRGGRVCRRSAIRSRRRRSRATSSRWSSASSSART
jgi:phage terminase large subunit-like protein